MKVAIILGSIRKGRQSHKVAYYLQEKLINRGIQTDLIDLAQESLPLLEEKQGHTLEVAEKIKTLSQRLQQADALLLVSPEYHGSFSGVLKNALDYFWIEFGKKPIGVATVSAGRLGGINASMQLQHLILSVGAFPLPAKLLVPQVQNTFTESCQPADNTMAKAITKFLDEFLWFAEAITAKKNKDVDILVNASLYV